MTSLLAHLDNEYQGKYPRWLFVCSAGMLRSATAAHYFAGRNVNTRCAGIAEYAVQPVHENTILWADEIFVMEPHHKARLEEKFDLSNKKVTVLGIPDQFAYRDDALVKLLDEKVYGSNR